MSRTASTRAVPQEAGRVSTVGAADRPGAGRGRDDRLDLGDGLVIGSIIGVGAFTMRAVPGIGCLNGWVLVSSEVSRAPADDGLFPRPLGWTDCEGKAWFGIVMAVLLPSPLLLWAVHLQLRADGIHRSGRPRRGRRRYTVAVLRLRPAHLPSAAAG